jgi:hypothetical protein
MTSSVPDRRRSLRVNVDTSSWLALPTTWSVQLIDVGLGGLSFSSAHSLDVGRTVYITANFGGEAFNSAVKVCWCKPRTGGNARRRPFEVGATFLQPEEGSRRALWRFLRISTADEARA